MAPGDPQQEWVKLGVIVSAHGVRGQVKIRSFTAIPEDLVAYGPLYGASGQLLPKITLAGQAGGALIATINGVTSRETAETLKQTGLFVPRSALPEAEEEEYYHHDLIGMKVMLEHGGLYGTVKAIHNFGAGDVLEIALADGGGNTELFPFKSRFFPHVDLEGGTMTLAMPEFIEADEK